MSIIADLIPVWIAVLTRPSVRTFDEQKASATKERTLTGIILAAVVAAVLAALLNFFIVGGVATPITAGPAAAAATLVRTFVQTLLGFYLFCYVLQYVAARFFSGLGTFDQQAYLISTYWVPVSIISQVLASMQSIGGLVAFLVLIYALVLTTFAVQSGQSMTVGNAILSWIIAAVATGIILFILSAITGGWL